MIKAERESSVSGKMEGLLLPTRKKKDAGRQLKTNNKTGEKPGHCFGRE